jgi:TetR/AcrR family transcriptional regulator, transcriptional repressor for nem operon
MNSCVQRVRTSASRIDPDNGMIYNISLMRYPPEHKDRVRQQIVQAASRRFRGRGSENVAIADLMSELRLTHGGFYRHFRGKEHLFNEAFLAAAAETRARMQAAAETAAPGHELEAIITKYLSAGHCGNPAHGCPIAALAAEISRHPKSTRATLDHAVREGAAGIAPFMSGRTAAQRGRHAIVLFASMAGTLMLARAMPDESMRRDILETARDLYVRSFARPH